MCTTVEDNVDVIDYERLMLHGGKKGTKLVHMVKERKVVARPRDHGEQI